MSWTDYELLQCIGDYGLSVSVRYDLLKFVKPGGFRDPAINTGHSEGLLSFALKFDLLPKTAGQSGINPGEELGGLQSRADYLWAFFCRHKQQGDKPFRLEFEMPGELATKEILCVFADDQLSYTLFAARMFSSGLNLEQVRIEGDQVGSDEVQFENPAQI